MQNANRQNKSQIAKRPTMLIILDGFGLNPAEYGNAIKAAPTPNLDKIFKTYPWISLKASGLAVGLPAGQMGNSEVGHLNIGAGRIVYQELTRITKAIEEGIFDGNAALNKAIDHVKRENSTLHIFGLLSDGGVHSHIGHIKATIRLAAKRGVQNIMLHCFMDGRDVPPTSGIYYIEEMEKMMKAEGSFRSGVVSGRYYAMDRDKRWDRVEKAYDALTLSESHPCTAKPKRAADSPGWSAVFADSAAVEQAGPGPDASSGVPAYAKSASEAVRRAYAAGITDEFIPPTVCEGAKPVSDGDSVIFCNFRPDRAREITRVFVDPDFDGFERKNFPQNLVYVCMTQYDASMPNVEVAFPPQSIKNTLGEYLSAKGLHQLRIAETEKYAHVTFFFNGGVETANPLEDRILIPSPKVSTYDLKPEMSAFEVTDKVIEEIAGGVYDAIILNFANADMVGHTGVFDAAVKAIEALDTCVGKVVSAALSAGGQILLTADHGNADCMLDESGSIVTAHSTNPVPLVHISAAPCEFREDLPGEAKLADIAPTMLRLMGLDAPPEMTGNCLIK